MGAIVAYKTAGDFGKTSRQAGMDEFGQLFLSVLTTPRQGKLAKILKDAASVLDIRYESPLLARGLRIKSVRNRKDIECLLIDDTDSANPTEAGVLYIEFSKDRDRVIDSDGATANDIYSMAVVLPAETEGANLAYLKNAVVDIDDLFKSGATADVDRARNYFAAFKFLTRCK